MSKISLITLDMDGVLVDFKDTHYICLNKALENIDPRYVVSYQEHIEKYDALPTKTKLLLLSKDKGLPPETYERIAVDKQRYTMQEFSKLQEDTRLCSTLYMLKDEGYKLAVCSNSVAETVKTVLLRRGFLSYIDKFFSNEDIRRPKPNPEIYLRCMADFGIGPAQTVILEDSKVGQESARLSGAHLLPVKDSTEVTYKNITDFIRNLSE